TGISWWEAKAFATFFGKDLPTEAQWEYACKGMDLRRFPWGNEEPTFNHANYAIDCDPTELNRSSTSVYEFPKNKSYFGCLDMAGNLAEWCLDNASINYKWDTTGMDPLYITIPEDYHIVRGGGGLDNEDFMRCSARDNYPVSVRDNLIGFRCVIHNISGGSHMNSKLITPNLERKPSSLRYYQEGPPTELDIDTWSLSITGLVEQELTLTYQDLMELPQVQESRRMVCVCNWSIRRTWQGVLLSTVMEMAGVSNPEKYYVKQTSIGTKEKGVYESTIPLGDALSRRAILVHSVDGEYLPMEQGYPLRLYDFGLYGYKNVKGLAQLEVTDQYETGEWERRAGYDINGIIRPKK